MDEGLLASPYKGAPGILIQPIGLRLSFPIQSVLTNYILSSIFTHQSEQLHFNQLGQCYLDQSHCEDLESTYAQKWTPQELGRLPPVLVECTVSLSQAVCPRWNCNTMGGGLTRLERSCNATALTPRLPPLGLLAASLSHS